MSTRLIIIPKYNESMNALILIERIFKYISGNAHLVIVDGSPDGTAQVKKEQNLAQEGSLCRNRTSGQS